MGMVENSKSDFVHLHNHSHYSILDGSMKIPDLIGKAKDDGQHAIALTDHGNLFGTIEFYKEAKKQGIKPIVGCEVYVAPGKRTEKTDVRSLGEGENSYHLVLLAKNKTGYQNLIKLSSIGYLEGFYYKPRVDLDALKEHHSGLIAMSACLAGEVPNKILRGEESEAFKRAYQYCDIFGKENFFLELQSHGIPEQKSVNEALINFHHKSGINLVASNDAHYVNQADYLAHDALLCIQTGSTLANKKRMKFPGKEFYLKTTAQMKRLFAQVPEAIFNTREIADMIDLELDLGTPILPDFDVPQGYSLDSYLEKLARDGLARRYQTITPELEERFLYELKVIKNMNFAGYFLIVQDFIQFARNSSIPVGPGRGSAAGSLVSYCLSITDLDPIRYKLLFERFLNPDRIEMPDVDIDFCQEKRDKVIEYVQDKYGRDRVCQVIAFGTMKSKGAIKDVGRVMDIPYGETDRLAKLVPGDIIPKPLKEALELSKELKEYYNKDNNSKNHMDISLALEGLVRQPTKHAAGIVISKGPLLDYVPLYKDKDGSVVTQYEKGHLEAVGLVKMDFLGLKNLTVIDKALKLIKEHSNQNIDFSSNQMTQMDDPKVFQFLATGKTNGIFQLESSGMQDLLRRARPENFEDIVAVLALFRPGPLNSGMVDTYVKRKLGQEEVHYDHPILEPILKDTFGVIVYQEQVMFISQAIGGFTMAEADLLRKIMGKKLTDKMPAQKEKFLQGAKAKNFDLKLAERIFDQCETFAEYGFNKSHSAAYAVITYRTAYLKTYFPVEYMAALISSDMDKTDKVVKYINDANEMGISILAPDIQISDRDFAVRGSAVTFGLSAIKNVGNALVESIIYARQRKGPFKSIVDFVKRIPSEALNRRSMESLVQSGAFDSLGYRRRTLYESVENLLKEGQNHQRDLAAGQSLLFSESSGMDQMDQESEDRYKNGEEWTEKEKLSKEKEIIGFYLTGHPLDSYQKELQTFSPRSVSSLAEVAEGSRVVLAGVITDLRITMSKRNNKNNGFFTLSDKEARVQVVVFNTYLEGGRDINGEIVPAAKAKIKEDAVVAVEGILQFEEGGIPKVFLKKIYSIEEAKINAIKAVHLKFDSVDAIKEKLESVRTVLSSSSGGKPVFLHLNAASTSSRIIRVSDKLWIDPNSDVFSKLYTILGRENVILSYNTNSNGQLNSTH
jgi:DNA polymerase-3 subunit alpha